MFGFKISWVAYNQVNNGCVSADWGLSSSGRHPPPSPQNHSQQECSRSFVQDSRNVSRCFPHSLF